MEERDDILVLKDEDGKEIEFEYLDSINYDDREYVVLLPLEEMDEDEAGEVVILELEEIDDDVEFLPVEDEDLLQTLFEMFKERLKDEFNFVDED